MAPYSSGPRICSPRAYLYPSRCSCHDVPVVIASIIFRLFLHPMKGDADIPCAEPSFRMSGVTPGPLSATSCLSLRASETASPSQSSLLTLSPAPVTSGMDPSLREPNLRTIRTIQGLSLACRVQTSAFEVPLTPKLGSKVQPGELHLSRRMWTIPSVA
ncbi:unnamed protein product [Ectocarpus fasciculatus]